MQSSDLQFDVEAAKFESSWSRVASTYPDFDNGAVDRHRTEKRVASGLSTAVSVGASGAQLATGTSSLAVAGAVVAGAAISATGIGLAATSAALTIGSMVTNARSLAKTIDHRANLKNIQRQYDRGAYDNICRCYANAPGMDKDHAWIGTQVLPYIISQKYEKQVKKGIGVAPLMGMGVTAYSIGRWAYKSVTGTKGRKRSFMAHVLARHLITHYCPLADAIVAELLSTTEMTQLKSQNSDVVGAAIKDKMKSV